MTRSLEAAAQPVLAAVFFLSVSAVGLPAMAQQETNPQQPGSPVRLAPPVSLVPGQRPAAQKPDTASPETSTGRALQQPGNQSAVPTKRGIEIDSLSDVDPNSIGAIDAGRGGLSAELWRGSDRTTIAGLLQRAPHGVSSPTLRDLLRRTLLSVANPPERRAADDDRSAQALARLLPAGNRNRDPGAVSANRDSDAGFLSLRADALAALGETQALKDLLAVVPRGDIDESMSRVQVETLMRLQEDVAACAIVRDAVVSYPAEPFWPKALMYCQILDDDLSRAILGVDLLREGGGDDTAFFMLIESAEAAIAGPVNDVTATDPSTLHMSLARATNQRILPEDFTSVQPAVLAAMAAAPAYGLPERAVAAEQAVKFGSLPASVLGEIYSAFSFGADELFAPIEASALVDGARARALLYQAAVKQDLPAARAEILSEAFALMREDGLASVGNKLLLPLLIDIEPNRSLVWFAATAGRALYLAGRTEQADAWAELAERLAAVDSEAKGAALGLWPYRRLSSLEADARTTTRIAAAQPGAAALSAAAQAATDGADGLADWITRSADYQRELGTETERDVTGSESEANAALTARKVILLRALLGALGERDIASWSDFALINAARRDVDGTQAEARQDRDPALLLALEQAGIAQQTGETVLLAAILAGDVATAQADLLAIVSVIENLRRVGLTAEARALAMEAAESGGL